MSIKASINNEKPMKNFKPIPKLFFIVLLCFLQFANSSIVGESSTALQDSVKTKRELLDHSRELNTGLLSFNGDSFEFCFSSKYSSKAVCDLPHLPTTPPLTHGLSISHLARGTIPIMTENKVLQGYKDDR